MVSSVTAAPGSGTVARRPKECRITARPASATRSCPPGKTPAVTASWSSVSTIERLYMVTFEPEYGKKDESLRAARTDRRWRNGGDFPRPRDGGRRIREAGGHQEDPAAPGAG